MQTVRSAQMHGTGATHASPWESDGPLEATHASPLLADS